MRSMLEATTSWFKLLLTILLINHSILYKVTSTSIDDVCNKANSPKKCHACLDSYPESSYMPERELVGATIVCANNQASMMAESFSDAAKTHVIFKDAFSSCSMDMSAMQEKLMQALDSWRSGDNTEAKNKLDDGINGFNSCKQTLIDVSAVADFDVTIFIPKDDFKMVYDYLDNSKKLVESD